MPDRSKRFRGKLFFHRDLRQHLALHVATKITTAAAAAAPPPPPPSHIDDGFVSEGK